MSLFVTALRFVTLYGVSFVCFLVSFTARTCRLIPIFVMQRAFRELYKAKGLSEKQCMLLIGLSERLHGGTGGTGGIT